MVVEALTGGIVMTSWVISGVCIGVVALTLTALIRTLLRTTFFSDVRSEWHRYRRQQAYAYLNKHDPDFADWAREQADRSVARERDRLYAEGVSPLDSKVPDWPRTAEIEQGLTRL